MATREQVLQALRAWLIHCTGLTTDKIIIAGDKGPRPSMPYLTVRPLTMHSAVGTGEVVYTTVGLTQVEQVVGDRRATVQVAAYGTTAADLLDEAALRIDSPLAQAAVESLGTGVGVNRAMAPISREQLRGTGFEASAIRDFQLSYRTETTAATAPHAKILAYDLTIEDDPTPPADLTISGSVTL